jgi:glutaredoxin 3
MGRFDVRASLPRQNPSIQNFVDDMNPVQMYATATCPYCHRAKALLQQRGVREIDEIRVDLEPDRRRQMIERSGRYTVPQIFIGETHVGGCDDLIELDRRGGLLPLLAANGG